MKTLALLITLLFPLIAISNTYYVSTDGDDSNPGTMSEPWGTFEHALYQLEAGDTLYLREGVYYEGGLQLESSGNTNDGYIIISSYPGESAVVDGSEYDGTTCLRINQRSYFKIENIEFREYLSGTGMWITACHHFEINNCEVHHCFYGIGVAYGSHDFTLNKVNIHHFMLYGFDATPVDDDMPCYNGTFNDCISHTGLDEEQNVDGFALGHGSQSNFVFNRCTTHSVYDGFDISSRDVTLNQCVAYDCANGGYKLWQDNISLINCQSYDHGITGVEVDWNGNPKSVLLQNCTIFNAGVWNVLVYNTNDTLQMYNCIIAGGENIGLGFYQEGLSNYFGDHNIFHCDNEARTINAGYVEEFSIEDIADGDWFAYSGQDENSLVSYDPSIDLFVDRENYDLSLIENAIAIDEGTAENAPDIDFLGLPRPAGSGYDIGAFEWYPITCGVDTDVEYCFGDNILVDFQIHAAFDSGNIFTAQLSDENGSFSSPVDIGELSSTASGEIICELPEDLEAGVSYRLRVISSSPQFTGAANTQNILISSCVQDYSIETTIAYDQFCAGENISVSYTIQTLFDSGNVFTAQLSDDDGDFASPITIGSISSITSGDISCQIPTNTMPSENYRLRVISSSPESTGSDNGNDIGIDQCVFLISPEENAQGLSLTPYLDWGDVFGAVSYSLQLARDVLFTDIVVDLDNISESDYTILIDHLENGETYYWRVMAELDNYNTGWSGIRRFKTFEVDYRNIISFQGLITGNNEIPIADGDIAVTFRLYESIDDETYVWSETQFINIINSYIMAYLGIIEPLVIEAGHQYFIGIEISEQEIDRFPLTASPYSIGNIRTLNNMNGDIRITGGNGIGITNNDGEILIELSEQWIIHDKNNESNEFIQIIKELKQEIEYLKRQNLEMRLKIEQIENRVKSPLQKSKTDASTSLPYE
jgi:hypothetical protein